MVENNIIMEEVLEVDEHEVLEKIEDHEKKLGEHKQILDSHNGKIQNLETNGRSDGDIRDAVNEAIKKSQEVAAKKLSQMQGGLSGLLGGGS